MLKYIITLIVVNVFLLNTAKCQKSDTTIIYLKNIDNGKLADVGSIDYCDFFRVLLLPDSGDNKFNFREYYKNGAIKSIGKYEPGYSDIRYVTLTGKCISYFPNGKRKSITDFVSGNKEGDEYLYYPTGELYCIIKNTRADHHTTVHLFECYDKNGNLICNNGNGKWMFYDNNFNLTTKGPVKNGMQEGEWSGDALYGDSIRYDIKYKEGVFVSGLGYDKTGKAYPFIKDEQPPNYGNHTQSILEFISALRRNFKISKDVVPLRSSLDSLVISFTIEKDGTLSDPKILNNTNPQLIAALQQGLAKCGRWNPRRYYGIPLRSRITMPYSEFHGFVDSKGKISDDATMYERAASYSEQILGY